MTCPLCTDDGGEVLFRNDRLRVVLANEPDYPGFTRVVWQAHVAEMTDLPEPARIYLMKVVFQVEAIMRKTMKPDKINLASLGNQVPHLHWHLIPRYANDPGFPAPVWAPATRSADAGRLDDAVAGLRQELQALEPAD